MTRPSLIFIVWKSYRNQEQTFIPFVVLHSQIMQNILLLCGEFVYLDFIGSFNFLLDHIVCQRHHRKRPSRIEFKIASSYLLHLMLIFLLVLMKLVLWKGIILCIQYNKPLFNYEICNDSSVDYLLSSMLFVVYL